MTATSGNVPGNLPTAAAETKKAFGQEAANHGGSHLADGSKYGLANAALTRPADRGHALCKYDMPISL